MKQILTVICAVVLSGCEPPRDRKLPQPHVGEALRYDYSHMRIVEETESMRKYFVSWGPTLPEQGYVTCDLNDKVLSVYAH